MIGMLDSRGNAQVFNLQVLLPVLCCPAQIKSLDASPLQLSYWIAENMPFDTDTRCQTCDAAVNALTLDVPTR